MKKFILAVMMIVSMAISAGAAEIKMNGLNLQGDLLYLPSSGSFAVGAGSTIAIVNNFVEVRGVLVSEVTKEQENKAGIGVGINLPKLINYLGGLWLEDNINASVGATALINLDGTAHIEPALYISVLNWQF